MVKIWGIPHNRRAKKFKGFVRIQAMKGGGYQAASWPRKGQYDKSPAGYERSRLFGLIQHWSTRPLWWEQLDALNLQVGTPYLARDILTKSAYGKLTVVKFKDGTTLYPEKIVSDEIQAGLDTISTTPGAMLVRTASEWVALEPGLPDTVLTAHGAGVLPDWQRPAASGGGGFWSQARPSSTISTSTHVLKGRIFDPAADLNVTRVMVALDGTTSPSFRLVFMELDGTEIIEVIQTVGPFTLSGGSYVLASFDVPPVVFSQERAQLAVALAPASGWGNLDYGVHLSEDDHDGNPFVFHSQCAFFMDQEPIVGGNVTLFSGTQYYLAIQA